MKKTQPFIQVLPLLDTKSNLALSENLLDEIKEVTRRDIQYTLQIEEFDYLMDMMNANRKDVSHLHDLRLRRNQAAAVLPLNSGSSIKKRETPGDNHHSQRFNFGNGRLPIRPRAI